MDSNSNEEEADLYDLLHLTRSATEADIAASYRKLARLFHPDKAAEGAPQPQGPPGGPPGGAPSTLPTAFVRLNRAYSVLKHRRLREIYDSQGMEGVEVAERLLRDEEAKTLQLAVPDSSESLQERVAAALRQQREQQQQQQQQLRMSVSIEVPVSLFFLNSFYQRRLLAVLKRHNQSYSNSSSSSRSSSSSSSSSEEEDEDYSLEEMQLQLYPSPGHQISQEEKTRNTHLSDEA
ncbi:hypothetical protein, conserved [Eimeria acervulina]|uniref:J domain-containing protein n=1 Tax=Eimeria acervulina TaxID=5801 RepID=U6GV86_EIMAC|nr:hypothetical protein, conserved [Eimeria acervulina]CDI84075.1 hypothetical protein, conserved [Eimeria acervulina]